MVNCATFNLSCTAGNKTNKKKEDKNEYFIIFQYSINIIYNTGSQIFDFKKKKKKKTLHYIYIKKHYI